MSDTSRRKFLAAAGAGAAAGAVVGLSGGAAEAGTTQRHDAATEPVVAYVQNPQVGVLRLHGRRARGDRGGPRPRHPDPQRGGRPADMSSHREAPEISKDPVADSTDVYAFVSPDRPDTVTLIANFIPLQKPDGGPNFYEFGDDVLYEIHVSNGGKAEPDITYQFRVPHQDPEQEDASSTTPARSPASTTRTGTGRSSTRSPGSENGQSKVLGREPHAARRSTSARAARRTTPRCPPRPCTRSPAAGKVFAGQRADAFHVDLGSVFDLGALRPFNSAHLISMPRHDGRQRGPGVQRAHHRAPGADPGPDQGRQDADRPVGAGKSRHRRLGHASRRKSQIWDSRDGQVRRPRALEAGLAARQPAVQRGPRADGREGPVERPAAAAGTPGSRSTSTSPSSPGCCRRSTRASSRTWRRTASRGRT